MSSALCARVKTLYNTTELWQKQRISGYFCASMYFAFLKRNFRQFLFVNKCNVLICERSDNWHDSPLTYIKAIACSFRSLPWTLMLLFFVILHETVCTSLFWRHIQVYWRVCCTPEESQRKGPRTLGKKGTPTSDWVRLLRHTDTLGLISPKTDFTHFPFQYSYLSNTSKKLTFTRPIASYSQPLRNALWIVSTSFAW